MQICDQAFPNPVLERPNFDALFAKLDHYAEFLAVFMQQTAIGYICFYANDQEGRTAYISLLAVDPIYQGMRAGSALLRACIRHAAEGGMQCIRLEVNQNNKKAIAFYERHGFVKENDTGSDSYYMICTLTGPVDNQ